MLTTPAGVTLLTVLLPELATKRLPDESKARPSGSSNPEAKVLTVPAGVCLLTLPLPELATKRSPDESKARP